MEMVIANYFSPKDLVHHPIETTFFLWMAIRCVSNKHITAKQVDPFKKKNTNCWWEPENRRFLTS